MTNSIIAPCLWLDDRAEEAASFYTQLFPRGRIVATSYYPQSSDNPGGKPRGSVLTVEIEVAGQHFTLLNGGPQFKMNPSVSFFVHVASADEADRTFKALAEGGKVLMGLDKYPWSERYGWVQDRYGASFQVITGQPLASGGMFAPCLMFSDAVHGKAGEAMQTYTRIFKGSVDHLELYAAGEGPDGTVKHGRFTIGGQDMVAMDSHIKHGFQFDEALSLQVMCKDQAEVDRYWDALAEGGSHGPCGWLKDRFGLSWQIVPDKIIEWITSKDIKARDRAFDAVMKMKKLEIAKIEAAFKGV